MQHKLEEAAATAKSDMDAAQAAHANALETMERAHEQALAETRETHSAELSALRAELEAEVQRLQRQLECTEQDGRRTLEAREVELEDQLQAKLEDVFQKQATALEQLQQKLGTSHQERVDDMRAKHAREVDSLKATHTAEMRDAAAAHKTAVQEVRAEMARCIEDLENKAIAAAQRHAGELQRLNETLDAERVQLEASRQEARKLQDELLRARLGLEQLEEQFKATVASHEAAMKRRQEEFDREKRHIKEQHKRGVEQLLEKHLKETADLKEQFDRAKHLQEMQIDMLQKRIVELQDLYNSRPSREEDLQLIAQLETDVETKAAQIKKLLDDMQFYKLELVNREQNYNKVFGAAPTVGIMNPTAKKPTGPQMRVVQSGAPGMNMGLPPLGNTPGPAPAPGRSSSNKPIQKRPSSGSMRRAGSME
ncbi:unnamed protein product [Effrenium voratum]|nr:unnamed protein product [Effrenium voratum]